MATELAKAYVQIIPSAQGITGSIEKVLTPEVENASKKASGGLSTGLAAAAGVAAAKLATVVGAKLGETIGKSLGNFSEYEQLKGGVETLFKGSADTVLEYAQNAYKTAGVSANEYMSTVTSFSASLLQSLGGDTDAAAQVANRAVIDMSDNANKMGTSMQSIQNAYQGFAKQNYTMLDNLKLGYGGTKTEMARLIEDASKMTDIQKDLNVTVEAGNLDFANIVNAISVMQASLDIAGTTSKEAGDTIEGSTKAMKAAWDNLLTSIADDNADIGELVDTFVQTAVTSGAQILPRVSKILGGLGELILQSADKLVPMVTSAIIEGLPQIIAGGIKLTLSIAQGIIKAIPDLIKSIPKIIKAILVTLKEAIPEFKAMGLEIVKGIGAGITGAAKWLGEKVKGFLGGVVNKAKSFLGIRSPSKLFKEEIGENISLGIASGIDAKASEAVKAANDLAKDVYSRSKEWADRQTKYQSYTLEEQIELWETIQAQFIKESEQWADAEEKIFDLRQSLLKENEKAEEEWAKTVSDVHKKVEDLENNYQKELTSRAKQIFDAYKLFDAVPERQKANGEELMENLRAQIATMDEFYSGLNTLSDRGAGASLVDDIRNMGPKAVDQLEALLSLTDEQLQEYVALYGEKQRLANDEAVAELQSLREETEAEIREQLASIGEIVEDTTDDAEGWGKDLIQNFVNGIVSKASTLTTAVENVAQGIKNILGFSEPTEGPLSDFSTYAPDMMQLFANGIRQNVGLVQAAANDVAQATQFGITGETAFGASSNYRGGQAQSNADVIMAIRAGAELIVSAIQSASSGSVNWDGIAGALWWPLQRQQTIHGASMVAYSR